MAGRGATKTIGIAKSVEAAEIPALRRCRDCGGAHPSSTSFCPFCGTRAEARGQEARGDGQERPGGDRSRDDEHAVGTGAAPPTAPAASLYAAGLADALTSAPTNDERPSATGAPGATILPAGERSPPFPAPLDAAPGKSDTRRAVILGGLAASAITAFAVWRARTAPRLIVIGATWTDLLPGEARRVRLTADGPVRIRSGDYLRLLPASPKPVQVDTTGRKVEVRAVSGTVTLTITPD